MPRGIPKNKQALQDIENEMQAVQATQDIKVGEIQISKVPSVKTQGSNEFGDEYTMEVISDNEPGADIFRIPNKDPMFEYRFLKDTKENMSVKTSNLLLLKGGWQVVPKSHLLRIGINKDLLHPDGSFHVGELILAFMPKQLFQKKLAEDRRKSNAAMEGVQRLLDGETRINMKDVKGIGKGKIKEGPLNYGSHNQIED